MSNSWIGLPPDSTGKKLDAEELSVSSITVQRERLQLAGILADQIAAILGADPAGDAYGLVVRPVTVVSPATSVLSSTDLAAGTSVLLDGAVIPSAKVGKLIQVTVASTVACKWVIQTRDGVTIVTVDTIMTSGLAGGKPSEIWRAPNKDFTQLIGAGIDENFRVTVTNLDGRNAANAYVTLYWDEV